MGMYGGDGGYDSESSTNTSPWAGQAEYLKPLFQSTFAGAFGIDPGEFGKNDTRNVGAGDPLFNQFLGVMPVSNEDLPGRLNYFGDYAYNTAWQDPRKITTKYASEAPTVSNFSPEEIAAQNIITARSKGQSVSPEGYQTGYSTLIPSSKTALEKILTGQNKINPASMTASNVADISRINSPDLDYRYWSDLDKMAGGNQRNPYLEDMIRNSKENLRREYYDYTLPALDTTAEAAGRYGGGIWEKLRKDSYDEYLDAIGEIETGMRGEAYNTDMNRSLSALGLGGELASTQSGMGLQAQTAQAANELSRATSNAGLSQEAARINAANTQEANVANIANILQGSPVAAPVAQADYEDIAKLAGVGESKTQQAQNILDAYIKFFESEQMEPYQRAALLSNLLAGDFGGTSVSAARTSGSSGGYL